MTFRLSLIALTGALCVGAAGLTAQAAESEAAKTNLSPAAEKVKRGRTLEDAKQYHRKKLEALEKTTPEEWEAKQKKRAEMREKWEKMTPEERAAAKKQREERREKWKSMTPEERAKAKADAKAAHDVPAATPAAH